MFIRDYILSTLIILFIFGSYNVPLSVSLMATPMLSIAISLFNFGMFYEIEEFDGDE